MTKVLRLMLDTMIYDLLVADPPLLDGLIELVDRGDVEVLTTHVQEDELAAIPDAAKRASIARVPRRQVATSHFVLGTSRLDHARLGEPGDFEALRGGMDHLGHTHDALIGATAAYERAVLVTEDARLASRAAAAGVTVWNFEELRQHLR